MWFNMRAVVTDVKPLANIWTRGWVGPVEDAEEGPARHEGSDNGQVGRLCAGSHEQHHIGVLQPLHQRHLSPELLRSPSRICTPSVIGMAAFNGLHPRH